MMRSLITNGSVIEIRRTLTLQNSNTIKTDEPALSIHNIINSLPEFNNVMPLLIKFTKSVHVSPVSAILFDVNLKSEVGIGQTRAHTVCVVPERSILWKLFITL
jgi:hypothetical protein